MELAFELEDDLFFADLSRQLSLLITEDDDDRSAATYSFPNSSVSFQPICGGAKSKGTGVFIPMMLQPRRKQRQGKSRSHSRSRNHNHNHSNAAKVIATSQDSYDKTNAQCS